MPSIHKPQRTFLLKINYYTLLLFFFSFLLHSLTSSSHPVHFSGCVRHSFTLWKNSFSTDVMIFGQDVCMLIRMKVIFHIGLIHWTSIILVSAYLAFSELPILYKRMKIIIFEARKDTYPLFFCKHAAWRLVSVSSFSCVLFQAARANPLMCCIWVVETFSNCLAFRKRNVLEDFT